MDAPAQQPDAWESFWRDAPREAGAVLWDVAPELAAAHHLPILEQWSVGGLPLIDVGCGNGTQTRYFARRYGPGRVIGVDVSATAVARAAAEGRGEAEFRRLDATDSGRAHQLHTQLGDADVYIRGVFHQCETEQRPRVAESVAALLGARGRTVVVEPAAAAKDVLVGLANRPGGPPPPVAAVFSHGITPGEMADGDLSKLFGRAGLDTLASGALPLALTVARSDGSPVELPSNWLVVGRNG